MNTVVMIMRSILKCTSPGILLPYLLLSSSLIIQSVQCLSGEAGIVGGLSSSPPSAAPLEHMYQKKGGFVTTITGARFSLFPNVHRDDEMDPTVNPQFREVVRASIKGLDTLGLEVSPATEVMTTCLLGPERTLFEAMRVSFGRASLGPNGLPRQVSMQCTFSVEGCHPPDDDEEELDDNNDESSRPSSSSSLPLPPPPPPPRSAISAKGKEFVLDAYILPPRVACQFAIYPLGMVNYRDIIHKVMEHAKSHTSVWKRNSDETQSPYFCSGTLDGTGQDVFDALQSSFAIAREESGSSNGQHHLIMTATITGNKRQWTNDFFERTCND